ncbi:MAG: hypothetical protein ACE5MM_07995 [Nitrospiraceae bacterium]
MQFAIGLQGLLIPNTNVPNYPRGECGNVYPSVTLVFYANRARLEYAGVAHVSLRGAEALRELRTVPRGSGTWGLPDTRSIWGEGVKNEILSGGKKEATQQERRIAMNMRRSVICLVAGIALVLGGPLPVQGQDLGKFAWQLHPFCDVLVIQVTEARGVRR